MVDMRSLRDDLKQTLSDTIGEDVVLRKPPPHVTGDFSYPTQQAAVRKRENPVAYAQQLAERLTLPPGISVQQTGPFLNFTLDPVALATMVIESTTHPDFGSIKLYDGRAIVEYSSPNYGKPLHVGHIRSTLVGDALATIFERAGYDVVRMTYPGDVGGHMGKMLVALQAHLHIDLTTDATEKMGELYAWFSNAARENPQLEKRAKQRVKLLEDGDQETEAVWKRVCTLSESSFKVTYGRLGIRPFTKVEPSSTVTERGKRLAHELIDLGVATKKDDSYAVGDDTQGRIKILGPQETAVYGTLDLGAAISRHEEFNFDTMVYVVGHEQAGYFERLFRTLGRAHPAVAEKCHHLSSGHLVLPEGKMSSREGNVILLDDVLDGVIETSRQFMEHRGEEQHPIMDSEETQHLAEQIGVGALKYFVLSFDPASQISYDNERAFSLDGKTAPFAQYALARSRRILENIPEESVAYNPEHLTHPTSVQLARTLAHFPLMIEEAAQRMNPSVVTDYAFDIGRALNQFYTGGESVINMPSDRQQSHVALLQAFNTTMESTLDILGIATPARL